MRSETRGTVRKRSSEQQAAAADERQEVTRPFNHWLWSSSHTRTVFWRRRVLTHLKENKKSLDEGCSKVIQGIGHHSMSFTNQENHPPQLPMLLCFSIKQGTIKHSLTLYQGKKNTKVLEIAWYYLIGDLRTGCVLRTSHSFKWDCKKTPRQLLQCNRYGK